MNISLTPQSEAIVSKYMAQGYSVEEIIEQALKSFDNQGQSYTEWLQREVQAGLQQAQSGKFSNRSIDEIIAAAKAKQGQ
ncbi:MAG: hypothetical protein DSM106950_27730 [Stigonema ocellatum SAG 48.90 = DSM 106950]|nr:hypothetical protein [Stigonema ocellatum SAG 48.90 = DSM 106950]